jgi:hypothetical protein
MSLVCLVEKNKSRCPCTYETCERKGQCCECVSFHRRMEELPGCYFTPEGERSYDRSYRRFIAEKK